MKLICLECASDMQEIKQNVFRCPCCGWGAEQLTIEGMIGMKREERSKFVADKVIEATTCCNTMEQLFEALGAMSYAIGGMICEFPNEERMPLLMHAVEMLGRGMQTTAEAIGEPSGLEIVTGNESKEGLH